MKLLRTAASILVAGGVLLAGVAGFADDKDKKGLEKAKKTVERITPAQPPKASSAPKPSPVGQPVTSSSKGTGYKPAQKSPESKKIVVPPPSK